MMTKNLSTIVILMSMIVACDTTPANQQDNYNTSEEDDYREKDASEQVAGDALDEVPGAEVLTAQLNGVADDDISGQVMIFQPKNEQRQITVILDNFDNETYEVYLSDLSSCNDMRGLPDDYLDNQESIAEVKVDADGTGRQEKNLYIDITQKEYNNKVVLVFNELREVVACGIFEMD